MLVSSTCMCLLQKYMCTLCGHLYQNEKEMTVHECKENPDAGLTSCYLHLYQFVLCVNFTFGDGGL